MKFELRANIRFEALNSNEAEALKRAVLALLRNDQHYFLVNDCELTYLTEEYLEDEALEIERLKQWQGIN